VHYYGHIEKILDLLYTYVAQSFNLARVLAKKKDPITHLSFIDELIKVNSSKNKNKKKNLN
jgi:hypothetical protein